MTKEGKGLRFGLGLIAGGVAGAGLALLLAPLRGELTRQRLRERGQGLRSRTQELSAVTRERLPYLGQRLGERSQELMALARAKGHELRSRCAMVMEACRSGWQEPHPEPPLTSGPQPPEAPQKPPRRRGGRRARP